MTLPAGIDPDELARLYRQYDGNVNAIAAELGNDWNTVDKACLESGLKSGKNPSKAHKLAALDPEEVF